MTDCIHPGWDTDARCQECGNHHAEVDRDEGSFVSRYLDDLLGEDDQ